MSKPRRIVLLQGPVKTQRQTCLTLNIDTLDLILSAENGKVYRPIDPDDQAIQELARDIAENGVLEPLVVTIDNHILSGHRRREAAILAGLDVVEKLLVERASEGGQNDS
ncbi:MAG: ParB N-terminal domain-containing protein [Sedimentisphaerales bacterium]